MGRGQERGGKSESKKIEGGGTLASKEEEGVGCHKEGGWSIGETIAAFKTGRGLDIGGTKASIEEGRATQPSTESNSESSCS